MSYSLYDASVNQVKDVLDSFDAILKYIKDKPQAATIADAKIADDMLPFAFQVHFTTDLAQKMSARLQGKEPAKYENNLKTVDDMISRVAEVKAIVDAIPRDLVNERQNEIVPLGMGPGKPEAKVQAWQYVQSYTLPNVFFHLVTAYDIARKEGLELGKMVYLTPFMAKHVSA